MAKKQPTRTGKSASRGKGRLPLPSAKPSSKDRGTSTFDPEHPDRQPSPNWDDDQFEDFEEREEVKAIGDELAELVAARTKLDEEIKTRSALLNAYMSSYKDDASWSIGGDEWVASFIKPKPRRTLVPELLVQQGVSMAKIEKATRVTPMEPYVTVRLRKQKS